MRLKKSAKPSKAIKVEVIDGKHKLGRAFLYLIYNDLHKKPYGLLEDVFVDETVRGRGIGKRLISEVIKEANKRKCYKLIATSRTSRIKVHQLYQKFGFCKYGFEFRLNF